MGSDSDCLLQGHIGFNVLFHADFLEAFEFWKAGQIEKAPSPEVKAIIEEYTCEKWATDILGAQVYDILRKKRVADA